MVEFLTSDDFRNNMTTIWDPLFDQADIWKAGKISKGEAVNLEL